MPVFKAKRLQGVDYSLGHLDNLQFQVASGANTYIIETVFSCHCFTEAVQAHHTPDWIYTHRGVSHEAIWESFLSTQPSSLQGRALCRLRHTIGSRL